MLWVLELAPGISLVLAKVAVGVVVRQQVAEKAVPLPVAMVQRVAVTEW